MTYRKHLLIAVAGLALAAYSGCGDDESSDNSSGSSSSGNTTNGAGNGGNGSGGSGSTGGGSASGGMGGSGMMCMPTPEVGECAADPMPDACECCAAEYCEAESRACCEEMGCRALVDCVRQTGCEGLACLQDCGPEIQAAGGLGQPGVNAAQALGDCTEMPCMGCSGM